MDDRDLYVAGLWRAAVTKFEEESKLDLNIVRVEDDPREMIKALQRESGKQKSFQEARVSHHSFVARSDLSLTHSSAPATKKLRSSLKEFKESQTLCLSSYLVVTLELRSTSSRRA